MADSGIAHTFRLTVKIRNDLSSFHIIIAKFIMGTGAYRSLRTCRPTPSLFTVTLASLPNWNITTSVSFYCVLRSHQGPNYVIIVSPYPATETKRVNAYYSTKLCFFFRFYLECFKRSVDGKILSPPLWCYWLWNCLWDICLFVCFSSVDGFTVPGCLSYKYF